MQVLEDELADSKLQCSKVNANAMAQKSNYEIAVSAGNLTMLNKSHHWQYSYFYWYESSFFQCPLDCWIEF